MRQLSGALLFLMLAVLPATSHAALRVVTTTQDLAALARVVGGEDVQVESLTPGTRDPHYAVAKPSMIRRVFRADLLLVVGADMEVGWLPPLLQSSRNARVRPGSPGYLDLSTAVPLLGVKSGPVSRALGDVHVKGNPHYWLDPRNGVRMAESIAARLGELDPEKVTDYQRRFEGFKGQMETGILRWRSELAHLQDQPVIAYHTSFEYLADFVGFKIVDEVEPKPGIAPSAASLSALISHIEQEEVGTLIMEPYYERRSARYLSERTGLRVAILPQSVGAEEGLTTYAALFERIVEELAIEMEN